MMPALEPGYRSIDTVAAYSNETEVGTAVRKSGLPCRPSCGNVVGRGG